MGLAVIFRKMNKSSYLECYDVDFSCEWGSDFVIHINKDKKYSNLEFLHEFGHIMVHRVLKKTGLLSRVVALWQHKHLWGSMVPRLAKNVEIAAWLVAKNLYTGDMDIFNSYMCECLATYGVHTNELSSLVNFKIEQTTEMIEWVLKQGGAV